VSISGSLLEALILSCPAEGVMTAARGALGDAPDFGEEGRLDGFWNAVC